MNHITENLACLENLLRSNNVEYKLLPVNPETTDIDYTIGLLNAEYTEGLSTLIYKIRDREFVALLRRDDRNLDLSKLKQALGTSRVSFATDEDLAEIGIDPGLGSPLLLNHSYIYQTNPNAPKVRILVDKTVTQMKRILTGSGSPEVVLEISLSDMHKLLGEHSVVDVTIPNPLRQLAPKHRQSAPKVIVDDELITRFLTAGVDRILPDAKGLETKLRNGERITAYMGFDPTGPYLHVGHAMGIRAMRILQQLGHRVIFLVGDYTARVGDPDKSSTRELLTTEKIEENMQGWKQQAGQIIDFEDSVNPVEFMHNYNWLSTLTLEDLIKLLSKMTVQQMLERDLFQRRLQENKPLQLQEMIYPLMQGYDSVAMQVDLELGGTDQIFNMMVGRDLVREYLGKDKFVRAHKLMPAPDALTMSKTKGNGINLSDSAENMYGVTMSYPDEHILTGLELLTDTPTQELEQIKKAISGGENPMQYKKLLAFKVVEILRGKEAAAQAQSVFESTVQNKGVAQERTKISVAKMNKRLEHIGKLEDITTIVSELLICSKGQAKTLIKQNGVELNGQKVSAEAEKLALKSGDVLKIGKRNWFEMVD